MWISQKLPRGSSRREGDSGREKWAPDALMHTDAEYSTVFGMYNGDLALASSVAYHTVLALDQFHFHTSGAESMRFLLHLQEVIACALRCSSDALIWSAGGAGKWTRRSTFSQVVEAVVLGRATLAKIRQNLVWALAYNAIGIPIAGVHALSEPPTATS